MLFIVLVYSDLPPTKHYCFAIQNLGQQPYIIIYYITLCNLLNIIYGFVINLLSTIKYYLLFCYSIIYHQLNICLFIVCYTKPRPASKHLFIYRLLCNYKIQYLKTKRQYLKYHNISNVIRKGIITNNIHWNPTSRANLIIPQLGEQTWQSLN